MKNENNATDIGSISGTCTVTLPEGSLTPPSESGAKTVKVPEGALVEPGAGGVGGYSGAVTINKHQENHE